MRILVFGDSLSFGKWDLDGGGWVQRIRKQYSADDLKNIATKPPREIYNLSVPGDTTKSAVKRLPYEVESRRWQNEDFVLVFAVGLYDTQFAGKEIMAAPEQYRDELDVLFSSAQHYSDKLIVVGLAPVNDELSDPWIYSHNGVSFKNERILEFEEVLRKVCLEKKVPCVQVFEKFQAEQEKRELLADGLHPNEAGHQLIAELVKPELDKLV